MGDSEDNMKVGSIGKFVELFLQPTQGVKILACGAIPISTRIVHGSFEVALQADFFMSTSTRSTASLDLVKSLFDVKRQIFMFSYIAIPKAYNNVLQCWFHKHLNSDPGQQD